MNFKSISTNVGKALLVSALFMFLSMLVSILNGMDSAFGPLSISFIITFIVGAFPFIFVRNPQPITVKDGYLIIVISWLLSFVFGMLPYILWGGEFTLINAWFESVSGYTTTGATILNDIEALPKSLLFWRSSTHYIGGLGVIVFLLLILPDASPFRLRLTNLEISSLSKDGYKFQSSKTVKIIFGVYVGMTVVETLLLWIAGMSLFDAINHSFSTVCTGGFSTKNLSIAHYNSVAINIVIMIFMFLSAMHFGIIYAVVIKRSFKMLNNPVIKYYVSCIVIMTVIIMISLMTKSGYTSWSKAFMDSLFQVISYVTTTGFGQADNANWSLFACTLLMIAGFQCGCAGSTTGGLKIDRVIIAIKSIGYEIRHRMHPSSVFPLKVGGHVVSDNVIRSVLMFIVLYILIVFFSTLIIMTTGVDGPEALSGVISSIGNVGPGVRDISTMGNYSSFPVAAKMICTVNMFLGRVEILPVLIVISLIFNRKK